MKAILISNTLFGHKRHRTFSRYFINEFIPYIEKNCNSDDILIHMGGLLNQKNVNIGVMNNVYKIFNKLSEIINIKFLVGERDMTGNKLSNNSYLFLKSINNIEIIENYKDFGNYKLVSNLSNIDNINSTDKPTFYNNKNIFLKGINGYNFDFDHNNIGCPYQIDENDEGKFRGFGIYDFDKNELEFVENNYTKKFSSFVLNIEDDIDKLSSDYFNSNIVHVKINTQLYSNFENKINVLLSQNKINKISYFNEEEEEEIDDNNDIEIEEKLKEEIKEKDNSNNLMKGFEKIIELHKKKHQ